MHARAGAPFWSIFACTAIPKASPHPILCWPPPSICSPSIRQLARRRLRSLGTVSAEKVALEYCAQRATVLEQAWILDSMPGLRHEARGSESTVQVLVILERIGTQFATRDAFMASMQHAGVAPDLAQWLAMNLEAQQHRLRVSSRPACDARSSG